MIPAGLVGVVVSLTVPPTIVATVPGWIHDIGAVSAVVLSILAAGAGIGRIASRAIEALGDRIVETARAELQIDELTDAVKVLQSGQVEIRRALCPGE